MTQPGCIFHLIKCTYVLGQFRLIADRKALERGGRGSPSAPRSEGSGSLWRKPGGAARVRGRLGPRSADLCRRDLPFTATQLNRDANICRLGVSSGTLLAEQRSNLFFPRPLSPLHLAPSARSRAHAGVLPPAPAVPLPPPRRRVAAQRSEGNAPGGCAPTPAEPRRAPRAGGRLARAGRFARISPGAKRFRGRVRLPSRLCLSR